MHYTKPSLVFVVLVALLLFPVAGHMQDADTVAELAAEMQASDPPFSYTTDVIELDYNGATIVGTLVVPEGDEPFPAILMLQPFSVPRTGAPIVGVEGELAAERIQRIFAEQGYASFAIDFLGLGDSDGDFADVTMTDQIAQTVFALDYLEGLDAVDAERISLFGWSHGGMVAVSVAGQDDRVNGLFLVAAPSNPYVTYAALLGAENIIAGLNNDTGEPIVIDDWAHLNPPFFEELFLIDPVADMRSYTGSLFVVSGLQDDLVFPQPQAGQVFLDYHEGEEMLLVLDTDHAMGVFTEGPDTMDNMIYQGLAWLMTTVE